MTPNRIAELRRLNEPVACVKAMPECLDAIELLRGAMLAQDGRERAAGVACGIPYYEHGCDWPEAAADTIVCLRAMIERLRTTLRPLVSLADTLPDDMEPSVVLVVRFGHQSVNLTVGDCRRAAEVIGGKP